MEKLKALSRVEESLAKLPSVGKKSAERMAYALLDMSDEDINEFAQALTNLKTQIKHCPTCGMLMEGDHCDICDNPNRDQSLLMIVSYPKDVLSLEKSEGFNGLYHVLNGEISLSKGIDVDDLGRQVTKFSKNKIRGSLQSQGTSLSQSAERTTETMRYEFYCKSLYRIYVGDFIRYKDRWLHVDSVNDYDEYKLKDAVYQKTILGKNEFDFYRDIDKAKKKLYKLKEMYNRYPKNNTQKVDYCILDEVDKQKLHIAWLLACTYSTLLKCPLINKSGKLNKQAENNLINCQHDFKLIQKQTPTQKTTTERKNIGLILLGIFGLLFAVVTLILIFIFLM